MRLALLFFGSGLDVVAGRVPHQFHAHRVFMAWRVGKEHLAVFHPGVYRLQRVDEVDLAVHVGPLPDVCTGRVRESDSQ